MWHTVSALQTAANCPHTGTGECGRCWLNGVDSTEAWCAPLLPCTPAYVTCGLLLLLPLTACQERHACVAVYFYKLTSTVAAAAKANQAIS